MTELMSVRLEGTSAVLAALSNAQPALKDATMPVLRDIAREVATGARQRVDVSHPHNLWRGRGGRRLSPRYTVRQPGTYWLQVTIPGGEAGRSEAVAEFANLSRCASGAALVRSLDSAYGAPGRILWSTWDRMDASTDARISAAVDRAAAVIETEASTVG